MGRRTGGSHGTPSGYFGSFSRRHRPAAARTWPTHPRLAPAHPPTRINTAAAAFSRRLLVHHLPEGCRRTEMSWCGSQQVVFAAICPRPPVAPPPFSCGPRSNSHSSSRSCFRPSPSTMTAAAAMPTPTLPTSTPTPSHAWPTITPSCADTQHALRRVSTSPLRRHRLGVCPGAVSARSGTYWRVYTLQWLRGHVIRAAGPSP
uniref:Uncharacterized protein n=1 Tax=Mycena chlorophos TaxID=658473 RepID=A0ABQ0L1H2_MYCCL|nr:predicted protein [Mycena chlorophos]